MKVLYQCLILISVATTGKWKQQRYTVSLTFWNNPQCCLWRLLHWCFEILAWYFNDEVDDYHIKPDFFKVLTTTVPAISWLVRVCLYVWSGARERKSGEASQQVFLYPLGELVIFSFVISRALQRLQNQNVSQQTKGT